MGKLSLNPGKMAAARSTTGDEKIFWKVKTVNKWEVDQQEKAISQCDI